MVVSARAKVSGRVVSLETSSSHHASSWMCRRRVGSHPWSSRNGSVTSSLGVRPSSARSCWGCSDLWTVILSCGTCWRGTNGWTSGYFALTGRCRFALSYGRANICRRCDWGSGSRRDGRSRPGRDWRSGSRNDRRSRRSRSWRDRARNAIGEQIFFGQRIDCGKSAGMNRWR
jgi:hypothetical protein